MSRRSARDPGGDGDDAPVARPSRDRPPLSRAWYEFVRNLSAVLFASVFGLRATGRRNIPAAGGVLLVSNHLSHLDVFALGLPASRPLNYVARSTLFLPVLGFLIRSVGGFPIQREGMGASGVKETLRRVRAGGVVLLFPEGTRTRDGRVAEIKSGIAVLASRAKVPVVPAGVAGTFEAWPRDRLFPRPHPVRVVFGPPIPADEVARLSPEALTALIDARIRACHLSALRALGRDLGLEPRDPPPDSDVGRERPLGGPARFD